MTPSDDRETSDTPEVDAAKFTLTWKDGAYKVSKPNIDTCEVVDAEIASRLEREKNALRKAVITLIDARGHTEIMAAISAMMDLVQLSQPGGKEGGK